MFICLIHCGGWMHAAKDSLEFLIRWMDRFSRYKGREVYLTGESYAGHYVPQLAKEIMIHNSKSKQPINLQGIMVRPNIYNYIYIVIHTHIYKFEKLLIQMV